MAYITQDELYAAIPRQLVDQALNDDGVGSGPDTDAWASVAAAVDKAINGPLSQRYAVPFAVPLPPLVEDAALVLAAELIYMRRGISGTDNPWTARADKMRDRLSAVGAGSAPLFPGIDREKDSISVITEDSKTYSAARKLMI